MKTFKVLELNSPLMCTTANKIISNNVIKNQLENNCLFVELADDENIYEPNVDLTKIVAVVKKIYIEDNCLFIDTEPLIDLVNYVDINNVYITCKENINSEGEVDYYEFYKFVGR